MKVIILLAVIAVVSASARNYPRVSPVYPVPRYATPVYSAPVPSYLPATPTYQPKSYPAQPYSFEWAVKDVESSNDYSHSETSDGKVTSGSYRVLLPDGRTQIVNYKADINGYVADVKYVGEAKYAADYKPAVSYSSAPVYNKVPSPVSYNKVPLPVAYRTVAAPKY
uniref:Cuticle protein n=1 Tax=Daphnia galeata TaxID=27404 RepID=A0A8J2WH26_9CRUS|nr:unnamed protein product [Daphnia galeata]